MRDVVIAGADRDMGCALDRDEKSFSSEASGRPSPGGVARSDRLLNDQASTVEANICGHSTEWSNGGDGDKDEDDLDSDDKEDHRPWLLASGHHCYPRKHRL